MEEEQVVVNKMELGQRVTSKKTGLPMMGVIVKILSVKEFFQGKRLYDIISLDQNWKRYYENWKDEPLYCVLMDTPQIPFTFEEFQNCLPRLWDLDSLKSGALEYMYNENTPQQIAVYPEQDLELV